MSQDDQKRLPTTWSPEMLKEFHKLIRTYWFELDKNANTNVESVIMDENGRIEEWPVGLFDQFEINASKLL